MVDFRGQKFCEFLYITITILFGVVGWVLGYMENDFYLSVQVWAVGMVLAIIVCVPDWPMFNKNPVVWLKRLPKSKASEDKKVK